MDVNDLVYALSSGGSGVRISKFGCQIYLFLFDDPLKFKFPVSLFF